MEKKWKKNLDFFLLGLKKLLQKHVQNVKFPELEKAMTEWCL